MEFERGETVQLDVFWKDRNKNLITPSSQSLAITDPNGTAITPITNPSLCAGCADCDGVGHYYYDYDTAADCPLGTWTVHWEGMITGKQYIKTGNFEMKEYKLRPS